MKNKTITYTGLWSFIFTLLTLVRLTAQVNVSAISRTTNSFDAYQLISYELFTGNKFRFNSNPKAIFFYIQGSEYNSVTERIDMLASAVILGGRAIIMEKRGCSYKGPDTAECYKYASKSIRVEDHLAVIRQTLKNVPINIPVILVGGSEGGDIASVIAQKEKRITQLILIGSAGGWSQRTELAYLVNKYPGYLGCTNLSQLDSIFRKIDNAPDDLQTWAGQPYKRWSSYLSDSSLIYLREVTIPILLIHGAEDQNVPVAAARDLKKAFDELGKTNLTYLEYEDMDHRLQNRVNHQSMYPLLETGMIGWLTGFEILSQREAEQFVKRVKKAHPDLFKE